MKISHKIMLLVAFKHVFFLIGIAICIYFSHDDLPQKNQAFVRVGNTASFDKEVRSVSYLADLDIKLKHPIQNAVYRKDGVVDSIINHKIEVYRQFGYEVNSMQTILKENKTAAGSCVWAQIRYKDGKKIKVAVTFRLNCKNYAEKVWIDAHEEMHVVQRLEIAEAFDDLKLRFKKQEYLINWKDFNMEEQAIIASILRIFELKIPITIEVLNLMFNTENFSEAWSKLRLCRLTQFEKELLNSKFLLSHQPDCALNMYRILHPTVQVHSFQPRMLAILIPN